MERTSLMKDRGVAGLNILLTVVVILFIIGFLAMIFAILGSHIEEEAWESTSGTLSNVTTERVVNESGAFPTGLNGLYNCELTITYATNASGITSAGKFPIESGNYSIAGCFIKCDGCSTNATDQRHNSTLWNISGSYNYDQNTTASQVAFDTTDELGATTDWFGIIIIITAMVILILLTVIIISAIKGTGFVTSGTPRETA